MQLYRNRRVKSKMRKLQVKRSSFLIEPANRPTETFVGAKGSPRPSTKSIVLESIGEIAGLIAMLSAVLIAWIIF